MPGPAAHHRPSIARRVLLGIGLGCLTTILSSWAIGALAASPRPRAGAAVIVHDPAGAKVVFAGRSLWRAEVLWHPDDGFRSDPPEADLPWESTPAWERRAIRTIPPATIYLAAGWPFLAMHMSVRDTDPAVLASEYEARGGLLLEHRSGGRRGGIALPLSPHWLGFAANSALFGAWWALGLSIAASRRSRRSAAAAEPSAASGPARPSSPPK